MGEEVPKRRLKEENCREHKMPSQVPEKKKGSMGEVKKIEEKGPRVPDANWKSRAWWKPPPGERR